LHNVYEFQHCTYWEFVPYMLFSCAKETQIAHYYSGVGEYI